MCHYYWCPLVSTAGTCYIPFLESTLCLCRLHFVNRLSECLFMTEQDLAVPVVTSGPPLVVRSFFMFHITDHSLSRFLHVVLPCQTRLNFRNFTVLDGAYCNN